MPPPTLHFHQFLHASSGLDSLPFYLFFSVVLLLRVASDRAVHFHQFLHAFSGLDCLPFYLSFSVVLLLRAASDGAVHFHQFLHASSGLDGPASSPARFGCLDISWHDGYPPAIAGMTMGAVCTCLRFD